MSRRQGKDAMGAVGVGVAACAACCAGPILGVLAATGLSTVAGIALFGVAGLAVLVPATAWYRSRRRRGAGCTPADDGPVAVELGRRP